MRSGLRLTERAEDGVYTMHGFVAMNAAAPPSSPRRLVTDGKVVEKAVERLREEFGWGPLAGASGPMLTVKGRERRVVEGGWWIVVPVDYHEHFHDPELCEFRVRGPGSRLGAPRPRIRREALGRDLVAGVRLHPRSTRWWTESFASTTTIRAERRRWPLCWAVSRLEATAGRAHQPPSRYGRRKMRYETLEDEAKVRHVVKRYIAWIRGPLCGFQVFETGD